MENVTITGLEIVRSPRTSSQGHTILANFSAEIGVFYLKGCVLVRTARQGIAAWLPKLDEPRASRHRSVTLNDEPTRNALLKAARETYIMMGGTEAEWRSRDDDEDDDTLEIMGRKIARPIPFVRKTKAIEESDEGEDRDGLATFLGSKDDA
jgi:hypothetical protein